MRLTHPRILFLHCANEGKRSARQGAALKRQGLLPGAPDFLLIRACRGRHGLALELKRRKRSVISEAQLNVIARFEAERWSTAVAYGWEEAAARITAYLNGEHEEIES